MVACRSVFGRRGVVPGGAPPGGVGIAYARQPRWTRLSTMDAIADFRELRVLRSDHDLVLISRETRASSSISFSYSASHCGAGIEPFLSFNASASVSSSRRRRTSAASSGLLAIAGSSASRYNVLANPPSGPGASTRGPRHHHCHR